MKNKKQIFLFDVDSVVNLSKKVKEEINPNAKIWNITFAERGDRKIFKRGATSGNLHMSMVSEFDISYEEEGYKIDMTYRLRDASQAYMLVLPHNSIDESFEVVLEKKRKLNRGEE